MIEKLEKNKEKKVSYKWESVYVPVLDDYCLIETVDQDKE